MSSETSAWAKEQRCGDPVTKAVLLEIANWAKPTGICEFLSVKRIAEVVEVSGRTVQRHIARLEDGEHGLGMIRRLERHREDGGQGANCFELIGYEPPQSVGQAPRRQSVTPPRQNDGEPGDNGVTRLGDKIIPPSDPDGSDTPIVENDDQDEGDAVLRPEHVVEHWNGLAARIGLPPVRLLTPERRRKLGALIADHGVDDFLAAFREIERKPFYRGQNDRGWRADFDFFLRKSKFIKLIEGAHDTT